MLNEQFRPARQRATTVRRERRRGDGGGDADDAETAGWESTLRIWNLGRDVHGDAFDRVPRHGKAGREGRVEESQVDAVADGAAVYNTVEAAGLDELAEVLAGDVFERRSSGEDGAREFVTKPSEQRKVRSDAITRAPSAESICLIGTS